MNRAERRASAKRAKHKIDRNLYAGHIMTPSQVQELITPIHMAIELLPLGLFNAQHGHDLAAFLNVATLAARDAGRTDIHDVAQEGVEVLLTMRDRVRAGKSWNVTTDERETLTRVVMTLDRWHRTQTTTRWRRALYAVLRACDRAQAEGMQEMDLMDAA